MNVTRIGYRYDQVRKAHDAWELKLGNRTVLPCEFAFHADDQGPVEGDGIGITFKTGGHDRATFFTLHIPVKDFPKLMREMARKQSVHNRRKAKK